MFVVSGFENSHAYLVATQWLCENWKKPIGLPPMFLVLVPIIFGFAVYIKEHPLYFRGNIVATLYMPLTCFKIAYCFVFFCSKISIGTLSLMT